eukprot:9424141-Alexandrium_andersonii.AAC.1
MCLRRRSTCCSSRAAGSCRHATTCGYTRGCCVTLGRRSPALTKLRTLGLVGLRKIVLLDVDLLPRESLDDLFAYEAPAAK